MTEEVLNFKKRGITEMWFVGSCPVQFKREEEGVVYTTKHAMKGLYYNDSRPALLKSSQMNPGTSKS